MTTKMSLDDAYYLVFKDLTKDEGIFTGMYDGVNGNRVYMFGIFAVMELIAYKCGDACGETFFNRFVENINKSEEKAVQDTKDEPQTEEWTKEKHEAFYTFLWNAINPNKMEEYIAMFEAKDEPQTDCPWK